MSQTDGILVTKRNKETAPLDLEKIHRVLFWATEDLSDVSVSDIEMNSQIQLYNKITTEEIHQVMIKSAIDLISEETPNYQYVAARLMLFDLRKKVFGSWTPPKVRDFIMSMVDRKYYDSEIPNSLTDKEWEFLELAIDHERELEYPYGAMSQWIGKYLVQNRATKTTLETPAFCNLMVALTAFGKEEDNRIKKVIDYYKEITTNLSLPTPWMAGLRTPVRQFSSCVLIEGGDTVDSIAATGSAINHYVAKKAGIGIGATRIRALGSPIRGGDAYHTGVIPIFRKWQGDVNCFSQGGVRKGSATVNIAWWHHEIEDMIVLKNNKGSEDNRVREMDYVIQMNGFFYKKILANEDIYLFSPNQVPELFNAFYENDQTLFEELYEKACKKRNIMKKKLNAFELFKNMCVERKDTGRIYLLNIDHVNVYSSFLVSIRMTNLCVEITLPTAPLQDLHDTDGEIALCMLHALNMGNFNDNNLDKLEKPLYYAVRALDNIIDYQEYPMYAARESAEKRRPVGVGVINMAYYLAKHGVKYSDGSANVLIHRFFEAFQYYLLKASNRLAKEKGKCEYYNETKYSEGILPIDNYKKDVDKLGEFELNMDWKTLRSNIKEHGLRNSTLSAIMPAETSANISGATNGIEPIKGFVVDKGSKTNPLVTVVPGFPHYKNKYEQLWDQPSCNGYLNLVCIIQKFIDQSISANTFYNPENYEDGKVPMEQLMRDKLMFYKFGGKALYYENTYDGQTENEVDDCPGGACKL